METLQAAEPPTRLHKLARRALFIPSRLGYDDRAQPTRHDLRERLKTS